MYKKVDPCLLSADKKGLRVTMPIGIDCPLKCKHCYQSGVARFSVDLGTNLNTLVKLGESGVSKLYWDGAEPMTNPDIDLYLKTIYYMKSKPESPEYLFKRVSIATNGMLVNNENARRLYDNGLKNIMVSLDGAKPKTHDYFRNKEGSFKKVTNAINILKKNNFDIRVGSTIWKGNIYELEDLVRLSSELGVEEIIFNWLQPVGRALEYSKLIVPNEYYQAISNNINEISKDYNGKIKVEFHRGGKLDEHAFCKGGKNIAYVSGKWVWPCSWISLIAPEFKSEFSLNDYTLIEILEKDPTIKKFRNVVEEINKKEACCPAMCKIYNGNFIGPDPISENGIHIKNQKGLK